MSNIAIKRDITDLKRRIAIVSQIVFSFCIAILLQCLVSIYFSLSEIFLTYPKVYCHAFGGAFHCSIGENIVLGFVENIFLGNIDYFFLPTVVLTALVYLGLTANKKTFRTR